MPSTHNAFRQSLTRGLFEDIAFGRNGFHAVYGGFEPWEDDPLPSNVSLTVKDQSKIRNGFVFGQRIESSDVSYVVRRIDWDEGSVYEAYDDTWENPQEHDFYVLTPSFHVFKCLSTGFDPSNPSTINPEDQNEVLRPFEVFEASDGYVWKYLYTLSLAEQNRFLSSTLMPVKTSLTGRLGGVGSLDEVRVVSAGSGYTVGATSVTVVGDGTGASVDFTLDGNGGFESFTITAFGEGYTWAFLNIVGDGTGAEAWVRIRGLQEQQTVESVESNAVPGEVSNIILEDAGEDYTSTPDIIIEGDGTGATASVVSDVNGILGITITNRGQGYTHATAVITGGGGTGAEARVVLSPPKGHGSNAVEELFSTVLCVHTGHHRGTQTLELATRQMSLVKGFEDFNTSKKTDRKTIIATHEMVFEDVSPFSQGDVFTLPNGSEGVVVHVRESSSSVFVKFHPSVNVQNVSQVEHNGTPRSISKTNNPDVDVRSGDIVYVRNAEPFVETSMETQTHKIFITL